jgi:hypothetical protein
MEWNEIKNKIVEKAYYYKSNEIKAHVLTVPRGTFKNGLFLSELKDDKFFWFIENNDTIPIRLFLAEIYEIEDYLEERK